MPFSPGTWLGAFVVSQAGSEAMTLLDAVEGPEHDEITLEATQLSEGRPIGFTFSARTPLLPELDSIYADDPDLRSGLDSLFREGGELLLTVEDDRAFTAVHPDRYERGHALIDLRNERSGDQVARLVAIRGNRGFAWVPVVVIVIGVTYIITRHLENMAAIKRCVPVENDMTLKVPAIGLELGGSTRVHKTDER
jgi:hypothetical protein